MAGAVRQARRADALSVLASSHPAAPLAEFADCRLLADTGPEVIAGSTRLKAGTAEKMTLNSLSTAVMIKLARTYSDLVVSLVAGSGYDIAPGDDAATIAQKIARADALAVTETARHLNIDALVAVVEVLATARRIDIYGVGASGFVALDLQQKLQRIGNPAFT